MQTKEFCCCGTALPYAHCCGRWHKGEHADTAETLMRSRYSAFVLADADYLLATWHPRTRPSRVTFDPKQRWLGLQIKSVLAGGSGDQTGEVEFLARFKIDGKAHRLHERSAFEREAGRWFYTQGVHL
ncbi:MAG: YchJ family metal-binding protein [Pseudomonadota bacterium]